MYDGNVVLPQTIKSSHAIYLDPPFLPLYIHSALLPRKRFAKILVLPDPLFLVTSIEKGHDGLAR